MKDLKSTLFYLFAGTLIAFTVWLSIMITVDPTRTDVITKAAFFASLFLTLTGVFTFIFIYLGSMLSKRPLQKLLSGSLMQSSLISSAVVLILILGSLRVLGIWEIFIIVLLLILTELYLQAQERITQ